MSANPSTAATSACGCSSPQPEPEKVREKARVEPSAEPRLQNLIPIAVVIAGGCEPCARRMVARALAEGSGEVEIRKTLAIVDHFRRQECFADSVGPEVVARMEQPLEAARQTLAGGPD